ncbi:MAG: FRG domain-containing protein [Acidobacteria bacterium]|nr:FRG domain-containing protein [Acidobacteriota bacterium]
MSTIQKTARSVDEFVKIVSEAEPVAWFRGHANAEWSLVPKFYRQQDRDRESEDDVREQFVTCAPTLSDVKPAGSWDWYFLMQHHGAPTRLLDWTEGALIGLYFAVREDPGHHHAAVWVLDPWELNRRVVGKAEALPPGDPGTTKRDRQRYERWLPDRFAPRKKWPPSPVAIYPGHIMRRIGAQRSCFTIHGLDQRGLEEIAELIESPLMKIVIPSWEAKTIRRSLATCGVDETTVFPDLEGLGKALEISNMEEDESLPHQGAYTRLGPSKVHEGGVGVFAIRRIRKNTPLFAGDNDEMVWVKKSELPRRPKSIRQLYEDFAVIKADKKNRETRYGCPMNFNRLTISWYLNHSLKPNVRCDKSYNFFALRLIEPDEELTVDYRTYSE